jgi:hypothetical protein
MSLKTGELIELIQQAAGTFNKDIVSLVVCTVNSVDEDAFTCDCTPISGVAATQIPKVKLSAEANDGFSLIPKVDSTVVVANSTRNSYYVFMYSDIQKVKCYIDSSNYFEFDATSFRFNDGAHGGIAKTRVIELKLNALETQVNALKAVIAAILSAGSSSPGTSVTNGSLAAYFTGYNVTPITLTTQAELSNNKITHGS